MAFVFAYTKKGDPCYDSGNSGNYPGLTARNCDVNDAMHLAVSRDGKEYIPLRNNTGILFPEADFTEGRPGGTTKTLLDPWLFRKQDGTFGVCAVRRNQEAPDPLSTGCIMLFWSEDLVRFREGGFLKAGGEEIRRPRCRWEEEKQSYRLEWENRKGHMCGRTRFFQEMEEIQVCPETVFEEAGSCGIDNAVPGSILEVSEEEVQRMERYLGEISHTGTAPVTLTVKAGKKPEFGSLPGAVCLYNDGSTHEKSVCWNREEWEAIDFSCPGRVSISGEIRQRHYPFPFLDAHMSDPCICRINGKFYLSASGQRSVTLRISDTLEGLAEAEPVAVYTMPESDTIHANMWAPELHVICGVPYLFTTVGEKSWTTVRSHVLRCNGDPAKPQDWEAPRLVVKPDGTELREDGITLDMTWFCVDGVHYIMWSDRCFADKSPDHTVAESADIYIATIDPAAPWQLTTNPVRILRPVYGWDRYETEVDEGPYLLRHGDDLFVTISGSSTGLADLYCVGLLHARRGNNLLSPDGWDWLPYPVLTKESVPGEFGPGHNCFIKDPESGDDLLIYHAVPHDREGKTLGRHMGIRRVHWSAAGYPYLEMTEDKDLNPDLRKVTMQIEIML